MIRLRARRTALGVLGAMVLMVGGLMIVASPASAAETLVTNTDDDGSATALRDVLANAGDGDTILLLNGATYVVDDCGEGALFQNSGSDITLQAQNTGFGVANAVIQQTCDTPVIDVNDNSLVLVNVTITGGRNGSDGGGLENVDNLSLAQVLMTDNQTFDDGDGGAFDFFGDLTMTNSTIAGNCAEDDGGAFESDNSDAVIAITNSTISDNSSGAEGAVDASNGSDVTLFFVTFGSNTFDELLDCPGVEPEALAAPTEGAPEAEADDDADDPVNPLQVTPANLTIGEGGTLTVFGTAIIEPVGGPNCDIDTENGATVTSLGYNFSDDDSCLFTNVANGDRENAGAPGLGALGANGGPTPTRLPGAASPLVNFIPAAVCQAFLTSEGITTDQRGITRPQDVGCEIGSVELELELVVLFTG